MDKTQQYETNLRTVIEECGYTFKEVAEETGISPSALFLYARGERAIPHDSLLKIAHVLGCSTTDIMSKKRPRREAGQCVLANDVPASSQKMVESEEQPQINLSRRSFLLGGEERCAELPMSQAEMTFHHDQQAERSFSRPVVTQDLIERTQIHSRTPTHFTLSGFDMLMKSRRQVLQDILNVACAAITLSPYELLPKESRERLELAKNYFSYLDDEALDDLSGITTRYWSISKNASVDVLSGIAGHFANIIQFLKDPHPHGIYQRLSSLAGENAQILGKTFHDIKEYDLAWSYYKFSLNVALSTGNLDLWAAGIGRVALLLIYWGEPQQALPLLQEAQNRQLHYQRIGLWLSAIEAEIHASMGNEDACVRSLEKLKSIPLPATLDDDCYATGLNPSRAAGYEGACFVRLQKPHLALPVLEQAWALCDKTSLRRQSTLIADIGMVHAQLGNPKEACRLLSQALDMTMQTKSLVVVQRVCTARKALHRWKQSVGVKTLDAQIADTFTVLTRLKEEAKM